MNKNSATKHDQTMCKPASSDSGLESGFARVDPNYIVVEQIGGYILGATLSGLIVVGLLVWGIVAWWMEYNAILAMLLTFVSSLMGIGLLSWVCVIWPQREYEHLSWRLDEKSLQIKRGVWWRHRIAIPRSRVQHADVSQGPLMRRYSLANLVVHTAGTLEPNIELRGLRYDVAQQLRFDLTCSNSERQLELPGCDEVRK